MKTKIFLLTVIFSIICSISFAQYKVEGFVKDSEGNPVSGANIKIKENTGYNTFSNILGYFVLNDIPSDTLTLIALKSGYQVLEIDINHRININLTFYEGLIADTLIESISMVETLEGWGEVTIYEPKTEMVYDFTDDKVVSVVTEESSKDSDGWFSSKRSYAKSDVPSTSAGSVSDYKSYESYEYRTEEEKTDFAGDEFETITGDVDDNSTIRSGMLTAGEIHDFSKWDLWNDITADQLSQYKTLWEIYPLNRYCVQLTSKDGKPLIDSKVELRNSNGTVLWTAHTDNTGKAELWGGMFDSDYKEDAGYSISIIHQKNVFSIDNPKKFHEGVNILSVKSECNIPNIVDIAFVVDATGSMSDEINYLKAELQDIIERAGKEHPELTFNLGSVFYRDNGDSYLTIKSDLSSDITKTVEFIKAQYAGGGGDFPEAVDAGLQTALDLTWSENTIAKMCFLVLDAPPHDNPEVKENLEKITIAAAEKGIRIIPVTCSGIDKSTEYLMRSIALATNGTYVFLTDDSGIGGSHIKPTTDEWTVEYLNDLIIRLINQYTLTPTCDNKLPLVEENLRDTSYLVIDEIEPILDIDLTNIDSSNVTVDIIDINNNPDFTDTTDTGDITNIDIEPYDYSKGLKYYPNPTAGVLNIEMEGEIKELFLADNSGKLLERYVIEDEDFLQLNLSSYPSGLYFIQYLNKDQWKAGQVILLRN